MCSVASDEDSEDEAGGVLVESLPTSPCGLVESRHLDTIAQESEEESEESEDEADGVLVESLPTSPLPGNAESGGGQVESNML